MRTACKTHSARTLVLPVMTPARAPQTFRGLQTLARTRTSVTGREGTSECELMILQASALLADTHIFYDSAATFTLTGLGLRSRCLMFGTEEITGFFLELELIFTSQCFETQFYCCSSQSHYFSGCNQLHQCLPKSTSQHRHSTTLKHCRALAGFRKRKVICSSF